MLKFIKHISKLFFVVFILTTLLSFASLYKLRNSSFYKPSFLEHSVKETNFDYVILGSSTGLTTLNTKVIDSLLETTGINLSIDDTSLPSQYLMLEHFLALGKSTKYCILAPNPLNYDYKTNVLSDNDYRFLSYINQPYVYNYYKEFASKEAKILRYSKWIPTAGLSYYNAELFYPSLMTFINPKRRNRFDDKGNYSYPVRSKNGASNIKSNNIPVGFTNSYLQRIKKLCDINNIQLVFYISPMQSKNAIHSSNNFNVINHGNLITEAAYFYDDLHVNYLGRQLSSSKFAQEFDQILMNQ